MEHVTDFFVSLFELKNSVWIIVGIIVTPHIDLLPQLIAKLKRSRLSTNGTVITKSRTEEWLRFGLLMGLTVSSVFVLSVILGTGFIQLDSTSEVIKWCSYMNIVTLSVLTFCSTRWGSTLAAGITIQKLFLIANTFVTCIVLGGILAHIFDAYIFSARSRQPDSALYFTMPEACLLTLFYTFNLLLLFAKGFHERFFSFARNISVAVLIVFVACNFYMLSTFPFRQEGLVKTLLKDPKDVQELEKVERSIGSIGD